MSQLQELGAAIAGLQSQAESSTTAKYTIEDQSSKKNWASVQDEDITTFSADKEAAATVYSEFDGKRATAHADHLNTLTVEVLQVSNAALAEAILEDETLDQVMAAKRAEFLATMESIAKEEGDKEEFQNAFDGANGVA